MNVIHGIGKPRIVVSPDTIYYTGTVLSANSTSVTLEAISSSLTDWVGRLIEGTDINGDYVYGKITNKSGTTLTVDTWYGGDDIDLNEAGFPSDAVNGTVTIRGHVIDLPFCSLLTEGFALDAIYHKLYNGSYKIRKRGWWYSAGLDYTRFMSKTVLQSLERLFNLNETYFRFYPRVDNPKIYYNTYFEESFVLSFNQGKFHKGHKGVNIPLKGTDRLQDLDLTTEITYSLKGYGDSFGNYEYAGNPETPNYRLTTGDKLLDNSGNTFSDGNGNNIIVRQPI